MSTEMLDRLRQVGKGSGTSFPMLSLSFEARGDGGSEAGWDHLFPGVSSSLL